MKAEATIRKEMQRVKRRWEFYEKLHGDKPGRSWEVDQLYSAHETLRWVLETCDGPCGGCPEYDDHVEAQSRKSEEEKP